MHITNSIQQSFDTYSEAKVSSTSAGRRFATTPLFDRQIEVAIEVPTRVLDRLKTADAASKAVHSLLDRSNQKASVAGSAGRCIDREMAAIHGMGIGRSRDPVESGMMSAVCNDHARLSGNLANTAHLLSGRSEPVVTIGMVLGDGRSHLCSVIGDPRVERNETVAVIDSWVNLPSAHLLSKSTVKEFDMQFYSQPDTFYEDVYTQNIQVFSNKEVDSISRNPARSRESHLEQAQDVASMLAIQDHGVAPNQKYLFDVDTFKKNPAVESYQDNVSRETVSFDHNLSRDVEISKKNREIAQQLYWN